MIRRHDTTPNQGPEGQPLITAEAGNEGPNVGLQGGCIAVVDLPAKGRA